MFNKFLTLTTFLSIFVVLPSQAGATAQSAFEGLVDGIASELQNHTSATIQTDDLASSQLRKHLFKIQNIADIYVTRYPEMRQVHRESKAFEDQIGRYRKSREDLQFAQNENVENIQTFIDRRDRERVNLDRFITDRGWKHPSAKVQNLRSLLSNIQWDGAQEDARYVFDQLAQKIDYIGNNNWNMFELEATFGLHSLRKKIRWIDLAIGVLTDAIGTRDAQCVDENYDEIAILNGNKCLLNSCRVAKLREMYSKLGDIKDIGEGHEAIGEHLPRHYMEEADELYKNSKELKTYTGLSSNLKACIEILKGNNK